MIRRAAETLKKAQFSSKEQFKKRFHCCLSWDHYKVRELVLVRNTAVEILHDQKHKPRYLGPYVIREVTKGGNYKLSELDGVLLNYTYAAFQMLPYITQTHAFMHNNTMDAEDTDSGMELELKDTKSDN